MHICNFYRGKFPKLKIKWGQFWKLSGFDTQFVNLQKLTNIELRSMMETVLGFSSRTEGGFMKRKVLNLLLFGFLISLGVLGTKEVNAATLAVDTVKDLYYYRTGGGRKTESDNQHLYYMDGHIGYCIEPGKEIYTYEYTGNLGMTKSPYSAEINKKIELIGHYGYEYPGHSSFGYRIATQALIWETVSGQKVEYYSEKNGQGNKIDIEGEKANIMNLVNTHTTKPNFGKTNLNGIVGQKITLEDTNKVLKYFEVSESSNYKAQKDDETNKLIITPLKEGEFTIHLEKPKYDNVSTMIFTSNDDPSEQKVAILRSSDKIALDINLKASKGSKLKVIKVDEETNEVIKKSGIKFKLKDLSTNSYVCENTSCTFETDNNGTFTTNTYLSGSYELEELNQKLDGYLWNSNKLKIQIGNDEGSDNILEVRFGNRRVKGKVVINKKGEQAVLDGTLKYEQVPLASVKFGLYALDNIYANGILIHKKGALVKVLVTDSKGYVECNNLYLGKYYIQELSTKDGYILDKTKYEFNLTYQNQNTEVVLKTFNLNNYLQKGNLVINKKGEKLNNSNYEYNPLASVKYSLYAMEDIKTNGVIVYKKDSLVTTLTTNSDGIAKVNNLPLGKYYVQETSAPSDYIVDKERHEFTLSSENVTITLNLQNNLRKGKVIITKMGEKVVSKDNDFYYEETPLANVKYGLYANNDIFINQELVYKKDTLIKSLETNSNGVIEFSNLPLGSYYLKELKTLDDYLLDTTKHEFTLTYEKPETELVVKSLELKNYLKKGNVLIKKVGEKVVNKDSDYSYSEIPLANVKYGLYANTDIYLNGILTFKKDSLIKTVVTNSKGEASITNLPLGSYYLIELKAPSEYQKDNSKHEFTLDDTNLDLKFQTENLVFKNFLKKGKFSVNKLGEKVVVDNTDFYFEEVPLKGVRYGLYAKEDIYTNNKLTYKKDDLIKVLVTDTNGEIVIEDLILGKYYLKELVAPSDFLVDKERYDIDLTEEDKLEGKNLVLKNYLKKGKLIINKKGEKVILDSSDYHYEEIPLAGIKYALYADMDIYQNGNLVYKKNDLIKILTTNTKGQIEISNLVLGNYYVLELETTTDNILDLNKHEFSLTDKEGDVIMETLNLKNYLKKGKLVVSKVGEEVVFTDGDYDYKEIPLEGVKYAIYANADIYTNGILAYQKGNLVKVIETDTNGKATLDNLPLGSYYIVEIATKDGYVLDSTKYDFTLTDRESEVMMRTLDLENHLKKGKLEFLKVDSETNEPIPETLIEIYKEVNGEAVLFFRGYTDKNGMITLNDLPLGKYLLREVKSSKGYNLSNEIFNFDITVDGDTEYITMKNDKIEEVEVPSTGVDAPFFFKLAGIILFLGGSLIIAYTKRRETND